jgi:hypothetical protein
MCTVTFSPRQTGYALAMNRDEQLTRAAGLPPARKILNGLLCPSEPDGGTWIAVNQHGVSFALINWYSVAARARGNPVSRGEIINAVGAVDSPGFVDDILNKYPLRKTNPFRLIGIFPAGREIWEWQWDLKKLVRKNHRWRMQQWISSGFDEPAAQRVRGRTFQLARRQSSAGSLEWLRRLHRSHSPETGPFSTCMHRADAATVSYTEILVAHQRAVMRYLATSPCEAVTAWKSKSR